MNSVTSITVLAAIKSVLLAAALMLALGSCARMAPPPGGPEDKTAPEIARSAPAHDAVNVARESDVFIEFSEPVNRPSVEASLYMSPEPGRRLRYRWSGKRLTLDYLDPLPENRTVVVTVGAQAKDMQGNPLESSQTVAFSTGDHIDRGKVEGRAQLPEGTRTLTITAYLFSDSLPDPMRDAPDYRMQTSPDGSFELGYLAPGRYRLFALDDRNLDGLWMPAGEWIGSANQDVTVSELTGPRVTFVPTEQDTSPAMFLRARQVHASMLEVRLNRDDAPMMFSVSDSAGAQTALYHVEDTTASGSWRLYLDRELFGDSAVAVAELLNGERPGLRFAVQTKPDTSRPHLRETLPGHRSITREIPRELVIIFDEPIMLRDDTLQADLREDTTHIDFTLEQTDPAALTVIPARPLRTGAKYNFTLPNSRVSDRAGNLFADSLLTVSWSSFPPDSLGNIHGVIRAPESGPWLVELYRVKDRKPTATAFASAQFDFMGYPQGDYLVRVIRDANANQRFDAGSVNPFTFSEPFQWHPDTLTIRARWTADVDFLWTTVTQQ